MKFPFRFSTHPKRENGIYISVFCGPVPHAKWVMNFFHFKLFTTHGFPRARPQLRLMSYLLLQCRNMEMSGKSLKLPAAAKNGEAWIFSISCTFANFPPFAILKPFYRATVTSTLSFPPKKNKTNDHAIKPLVVMWLVKWRVLWDTSSHPTKGSLKNVRNIFWGEETSTWHKRIFRQTDVT